MLNVSLGEETNLGEKTMRQAEKLEKKRTEAAERQARWDSLTNEEKLKDLDRRGERAEKQRTRIKAAIEEAKKPKKGAKVEKEDASEGEEPKEKRPPKASKKKGK